MLSIDALYLVFFTTGFTVGFGHCIGMCGPIVASFSLNLEAKNSFLAHGLYNAGRILTYAVLGGVMGAVGSFTAVSARLVGLQQAVLIAAGVLIMAMGLVMNDWLPLGKYFRWEDSGGGYLPGISQTVCQRVCLCLLSHRPGPGAAALRAGVYGFDCSGRNRHRGFQRVPRFFFSGLD
jgi:hypothetical protein